MLLLPRSFQCCCAQTGHLSSSAPSLPPPTTGTWGVCALSTPSVLGCQSGVAWQVVEMETFTAKGRSMCGLYVRMGRAWRSHTQCCMGARECFFGVQDQVSEAVRGLLISLLGRSAPWTSLRSGRMAGCRFIARRSALRTILQCGAWLLICYRASVRITWRCDVQCID